MNKKILTALLVVLTIASFAFAQKVTIDLKFNTVAADPKVNYFNWTKGKLSVKDSFDAATGASKAGSTVEFNAVRYDNAETTKKAAVPAGLRGLVLYPVSDDATRVFDAFTATAKGKDITVLFVHRGTAYEFTAVGGKVNVLTGFKMAPGLAAQVGGVFTVKPEYSKTGAESTNMNDIDFSKVTWVADKFSPEASMHYEGTLAVTLKNNILTVKGTLTGK